MSVKKLTKNIVSLILIAPIRIYQYGISPLTSASCRHVPTCSEYAAEALKLHGAVKGGKLAVNRILRCNPWGTSGFDPVPRFLIKIIDLNKYQGMNKKTQKSDRLKKAATMLTILLSAFTLISIPGCTNATKDDSGKIKVLVSILPHKYFVEQIAGDLADIQILIPPGSNHHIYDPTPRQMKTISKSDVYFYNGNLTFEHLLLPSIKANYPGIKLVKITEGIELIAGHECDPEDTEHSHDHEGVDPHTWLSARNGVIKAANILNALIEAAPEHKEEFIRNYDQLKANLHVLDEEIAELLSNLPNREFLIFHPTLGYFARDYQLEQISIEYEGKEPTPSQLKSSIDQARKGGVKIIFIQKEFDATNAQIVAKELNCRVVQIDPLSENWYENMLEIASLINASNK
ncbi:MAG: membrane protein insertion efficiency factor YidD [Bacteroidales bacterium]|nr:membrane protein insertion efficiency factor YidD [Bacteroidales bacterium]